MESSNVWTDLLKQASDNNDKDMKQPTILCLGSKGCGKKELLKSLGGIDQENNLIIDSNKPNKLLWNVFIYIIVP